MEERLSAVAKRRRLNGNVANGTASSTTISRPVSPAGPLSETASVIRISTPIEKDDNEFAALIENNVVQFSNFREIEKVTDEAIKIRLSRGQRCSISGRFLLWLKSGVVDHMGAKLDASSILHYCWSAPIFETAAIVALSDTAEFEVHSHYDEIPQGLGSSWFEWQSVDNLDDFQVSFFIHGYSSASTERVPTLSQFDDYLAKDVARKIGQVLSLKPDDLGPTVLFCGKQSPGIAMLTRNVINGMITAKSLAQRQGSHRGVLFLDLDSELPVFGLPGTISLSYIGRPVLSPPFTLPRCMGNIRKNDSNSLVAQLYVGNLEYDAISRRKQLDTMLASVKDFRERNRQLYPLLVKAHDWLEDVDVTEATSLAKVLAPKAVICFGLETASHSGQAGQIIGARSNGCSFTTFTTPNSKDPPLHVQHELVLQAYFHFRGYTRDQSQWYELPITVDQQCQVWLPCGAIPGAVSRILLPGITIESHDLGDVLNGCMVVIMLHRKKSSLDHDELADLDTVNWSQEQEVLWTADPARSSFIGFGVVKSLDVMNRQVCLITPLAAHLLEVCRGGDVTIELVLQRAEPEGLFDTAWVQLECGTSDERRSKKVVHRRVLVPNKPLA